MKHSQTGAGLGRRGRLLLCCMVLAGLLAATGRAVSQVTAQLRPDFTIIIDGAQRTFYNAGGQEVHPVLYNGTTYLPVRAIGELMGKNVDWNQTTKTVTLAGTRTAAATAGTPDSAAAVQDISAELRDDFTVVVDGTVRTFADAGGNRVYPLLYQGTTYLPIRAIGELMGKSVSWDQTTKTVTLDGSLVTDADTFSGGTGTTAPSTTTPGTTTPSSGSVSLEDAKAAALAHAGLSASQVTFSKQKLDWEDGQQVYEIEFYTADYTEYEYEISASTGAILSSSREGGITGTGGRAVDAEGAKSVALSRVPGATASHVTKCKSDYDDGRLCYEVEIVYDCMEYDFDIDAATGAILSADTDVIPCNHAHHSSRQHHSGHHCC